MQTVTLQYTESDDEMGNEGYNIVRRGKHTISTEGISATLDARLLTHDVLEHWDFRQEQVNLQEIVALGTTLAHRESDFINDYTGDNSFGYELASQLYYMLETGVNLNYLKMPRSSNEIVHEYLNEHWKDTLETVDLEYAHIPTNARKLKAVAYRFLARGYNHVKGIEARYGDYAFSNMFYDMQHVLEQGLKHADRWEGRELKLRYSFAKREISLGQTYETEDDCGHYKTTNEFLSSN
jgi:hypothetical protein